METGHSTQLIQAKQDALGLAHAPINFPICVPVQIYF